MDSSKEGPLEAVRGGQAVVTRTGPGDSWVPMLVVAWAAPRVWRGQEGAVSSRDSGPGCSPGAEHCVQGPGAGRSPHEQLLQPLLDGAVRVGALAEVLDGVHAVLERLAAARHAREPTDDLHLVAVVQGARVPHQVAVTAVVPAGAAGQQAPPGPSLRPPGTPGQPARSAGTVPPVRRRLSRGRRCCRLPRQREEPPAAAQASCADLRRRVPGLGTTRGRADVVRGAWLQPATTSSPDL